MLYRPNECVIYVKLYVGLHVWPVVELGNKVVTVFYMYFLDKNSGGTIEFGTILATGGDISYSWAPVEF